MTLIHFLNGKFVSEDELLISPRDLGFMRGYAVADYIVTYNHKIIKLNDHVNRLFKSAEIIGLTLSWSKDQIATWLTELVNKNNIETDITIKTIVSGGVSKSMHQAEIPTIVMIVNPFTPKPSSYYEQGVKAITVKFRRSYPKSKHTNYVEAIKQLSNIVDDSVVEIIYYDDIQVTEGSGNNIFAVIDNKLVTPKSNIIEGITRNTLLEVLKLSIPIEVRDFTCNDLSRATEVFFTGSGRGVTGIVEIDKKPLGDGKVGAITKEVAKQYNDYLLHL